MSIDLGTVLKRKDDIRFRMVGDQAVIVRQSGAEVLALNRVGARVLELIDAEKSLSQVIDDMLSEYDAERTQLEKEVSQFVEELSDSGVLEKASI